MSPPTIGVLASGNGSNLQALIDCQNDFDYRIAVVISSRRNAYCLERARAAGIPAFELPYTPVRDGGIGSRNPGRRAYEESLIEALSPFDVDLIVLAGWMLILSSDFLASARCPVINVHPALLQPEDPGFPVLRGAHCVRDAVSLDLPYTGVSVHHVIPEVDAGPVIVSERVQILAGDDEESLYDRVKKVEHRLLPQAVGIVLGRATSRRPEPIGV